MDEAEPEVVFHLAAQSLVRRSYADPVGTFATNVMGTVHVLEAARRVGRVRAVVVVTSDKCYENREWWWPYREDEALGGHDPYSSSKGVRRAGDGGVAAVVLRRGVGRRRRRRAPATSIGGGDWAEDRLVPDCMRAFGAGEAVSIRRPGRRAAVAARARAAGRLPRPRRAAGRRAGGVRRGLELRPAAGRGHAGRVGGGALGRRWGDGARWERDPDPGTPRGRAAAGRRVEGTSAARLGTAAGPRDDLATGPSSGIARSAAGDDAATSDARADRAVRATLARERVRR